ncbi:hypothetical protein MOQ72_40065 [Saccharopolyspora sp. K220]|uniref:hypothetical protein n=1 Tax=Saccharopolyspora soli TaxID=2926618 RepID=UPI001F57BD1E|nr:hypothetical protein [Saccharopolyspora soli]MCI2423620.1 hypothetical protein [Saccharopolyspora soli]
MSQIQIAERTGSFFGNAGSGRVASSALAEYAEAAAVVLSTTGHENTIYELAGDTAWTYDELATTLSRTLQRDIRYENLSESDHIDRLASAGLARSVAEINAAIETNTVQGALEFSNGTLSRLIGHETETIDSAVRRIVRSS